MAVFRVEKTKDFTIMSNHHLRNTELSLKAKGLAAQQNASCRFMKPVRRLSARLPAGSYRQMGGID